MSEHPNVTLVRLLYDASAAGDAEALSTLMSDCVWHVPGENLLAGTYRGSDEILGLFARGRELTDGTLTFDVHDVLGDGDHAAGLDRVTARRPDGRTIELSRIVIAHVTDGRLIEIWLHPEDQYTFDEFWS